MSNVTRINFSQGRDVNTVRPEIALDQLDFTAHKEPTRMDGKSYVVKDDGEVIGIVGNDYKVTQHADYFREIEEVIPLEFGVPEVRTMTARKGAWALRQYTYKGMQSLISNDYMESSLLFNLLAWHGLDGLTSNNTLVSSKLSWCLNTQVHADDMTHVRRKNTSNFDLALFVKEIESAPIVMQRTQEWCNNMARTHMGWGNCERVLKELFPSDRQREKMTELVKEQAATWGPNVYSLYNAFTNYATYADERNGFTLRRTKQDNTAERIHKRNFDVTGWVQTPAFQSLLAA